MMELKEYELEGAPSIFYRPGTSDEIILANNIGEKSEYNFPETDKPKVILDVGANIGVISVLMALLYPEADIYAFEPHPETFKILKKNVEKYPKIHAYNVALTTEKAKRTLFASDDATNFGGASLFAPGCDMTKPSHEVECIAVSDFVDSLGKDVDMIKIDAEGSEFEVLNGLRRDQLDKVSFVLGELHGTKDFETLGLLSDGFHLAFQKPMQSRVFQFYGQSKKAVKIE